MSVERAKQLALRNYENPLYIVVEVIDPIEQAVTSPNVAGCFITGKQGPRIEKYLFDTAKKAAKAYHGEDPLIISLNLYQEVDLNEYLNSPTIGPIYYDWAEDFFSKHRHVPTLIFSSNYNRYLKVYESDVALDTKYLVVESQYWEDVVPKIGLLEPEAAQ